MFNIEDVIDKRSFEEEEGYECLSNIG